MSEGSGPAGPRGPATVQALPVVFDAGGVTMALDSVQGQPLPLLRVRGWSMGAPPRLSVETADGVLAPAFVSREHRADVAAAVPGADVWCGYVAEFHLRGQTPRMIVAEGHRIAVDDGEAFGTVLPPHLGLFDSDVVYHREDVYGQGPPTDTNPQLLSLFESASGRVLDFGCGSGDLVAWLRGREIDAVGLELDDGRIAAGLKPEAAPFVVLYDGEFPVPYPDGSFDCVIATEVIEHIAQPERLGAELARVLLPGGQLLVTVPDASSIPKSFTTNTVPWHLLESTHVNFFTYASLARCLGPAFEVEEYFSLFRTEINGVDVPGSLGVRLRRKE